MSFVRNRQDQISFQNGEYLLTGREKAMLKNSWASFFAESVFPKIDEEPFAVLYSEKDSRPNTPVNVQVGALILKELHGLSDDGVFTAMLFDLRFRIALHTEDFEEQPMSDRTLGRFRERCRKYEEKTGADLIGNAVKTLSKEMAKLMRLDDSLKRMDSMMISSNIKRMSRLELLYVTLANAVKAVENEKGRIEADLEDYTDDSNRNVVIYHNRSEDTERKIDRILRDAQTLLEQCPESGLQAVELLKRVLDEQTVEEDGKLRLRTEEDGGMNSSMLQSPFDPDATCRTKHGEVWHGYSANFVETAGPEGSVVEDYDLQPNNYSDDFQNGRSGRKGDDRGGRRILRVRSKRTRRGERDRDRQHQPDRERAGSVSCGFRILRRRDRGSVLSEWMQPLQSNVQRKDLAVHDPYGGNGLSGMPAFFNVSSFQNEDRIPKNRFEEKQAACGVVEGTIRRTIPSAVSRSERCGSDTVAASKEVPGGQDAGSRKAPM